MLSLSSINNQSPGTPLVPMSRPALTQEAVRSASPLAEIQPATAISRERSRTEAKPKDPAAVGELAQQTQAEQMLPQKAVTRTPVQASQGGVSRDAPPSEKNPIQRALDTQIKDVLNSVWEASGKAVDFLLGRRESLMEATLKEVLLPGEVDYLGVTTQVSQAATKNSKPDSDVVQYTAKGGSGALGDGRGQILDMVV